MSSPKAAGRRRASSTCGLLLAVLGLAACAPQAAPTPIIIVVTSAPPTATPLPTLTPVPAPMPAGLFVDAGQDLGPISPLVYGTNYGPQLFVPLQMQPYAEAARLTLLRYPGGNWGDNNDIELWNLDQLAAFARQLGAEINVHVRLKGGTAQKAADLVRYANVEKGYHIRYWTIGNEPNLFADYTVEQFNADWREFAEAMRAVDPSIMLVGPEINQFYARPANAYEQALTDWAAAFLKANGDRVDIVSFHRYPFPKSARSGPPTIEELRAHSAEWDALVPAMRALVRQYAGRDLPIAVTEANSSWVPTNRGEATLDSHFNAIWWADSLGRLIRQGVFMVNQFAIVGDWGLMDNYEVKPIYHVYRMYQRFGVRRAYASSDDPTVSIFAARRADGALTLLIVNLASAPVERTLTFADAPASTSAETWLFDHQHPAEQVAPTPLAATSALTLPAESVTLLIVPSP